MQDYRNEVKEILSGDEQLAAEMEFALKIAEKERATVEQLDNDSLAGDGKKAQVRAQCKPLWTHWFHCQKTFCAYKCAKLQVTSSRSNRLTGSDHAACVGFTDVWARLFLIN